MTREELLQNAKPILFNTDMVRAILDGRKTVTRRLIKPQPKSKLCYAFAGSHKKDIGRWVYPSKTAHEFWGEEFKLPDDITEEELKKKWNPPYHADDILYVRETWCLWYDGEKYFYIADKNTSREEKRLLDYDHVTWSPSIHMPKKAARIFLKVTDVRVERLKNMTDKDALKEGAQGVKCDHAGLGAYGCTDCMKTGWLEPPMLEFMGIWDSTIKKSDLDRYGWDANPWVWVIEFEVIQADE
ncbi:hypothetical protein ACQRAS_15490 [Coprococcus catus]